VHSSGHPILDGDGRLLGWAGSTHPVISVAQEGATGGMKPAAPHLRVMWVDDSEDALDFARLYFKNFAHGIELFATPTGGDAIQAYSNALMLGKPFDVVILDYMMLGMNGAEVARVIRHQEKLQSTGQSSHHARIAFCSGADEQISVEVCNELDVSRRFPKPFVIAEVAEWIKSGR
jgi:CheY-like chemotaxis protein